MKFYEVKSSEKELIKVLGIYPGIELGSIVWRAGAFLTSQLWPQQMHLFQV